jgi:predicted ester cyclase
MVLGLLKFADAFPDGRGEILNLVACGETVVVEWLVHGTHAGRYEDQPPTGRRFERRGCSVAEVRDGKIVGYRDYFDRLTLTEQLGLA